MKFLIILAVVAPVSIILLCSLCLNCVFILVEIPNVLKKQLENGQTIYNETLTYEFVMTKEIINRQNPAKILFQIKYIMLYVPPNINMEIPSIYEKQKIGWIQGRSNDIQDINLYRKIGNIQLLQQEIFNDLELIVSCKNGFLFRISENQYEQSFLDEYFLKYDSCADCFLQDAKSFNIIYPQISVDIQKISYSILFNYGTYECSAKIYKNASYSASFLVNSDPQQQNALIIGGTLFRSDDGVNTYIANISEFLKIRQNETDIAIDKAIQKFNCSQSFTFIIYQGIDEQMILFLTAFNYNFEEGQCLQSYDKNYSIIFLNVMSYLHYEDISGLKQINNYSFSYISIVCVIIVIFFCYGWRTGVKLAYSFIAPLLFLKRILNSNIKELCQQELSLEKYQDFCNSSEISNLITNIIEFLNAIKFSINDIKVDANTLFVLSKAKLFYKKYRNIEAIGIISNNLSRIHAANKRFIEAMNEQEQSIIMGEVVLQSYLKYIQYEQVEQQNSPDQLQLQRLKSKLLYPFVKDVVSDRVSMRNSRQSEVVRQESINLTTLQQRQKSQTMNFISLKKKDSITINKPRGLSDDPKNSQQFNNNIAEESQELEEQHSISISDKYDIQTKLTLVLIKRKFQFIKILILFSNRNKDLFIQEILELLEELELEIKQLDINIQQSFNNLQLLIMIKKSFYLTKDGQLEKAQQVLNMAKIHGYKEQLDINSSIDIFYDIPISVINQRISINEAYILFQRDRISGACHKFLEALSAPQFCMQRYKYSLHVLNWIFKNYGLDVSTLEQFQTVIKDQSLYISILIDYTNQMTYQQFNIAHSYAKYIIQQLDIKDLVELNAYNEIIYQIFPSQNKNQQLLKSLDKVLLPPGGQSDILKIIIQNIEGIKHHSQFQILIVLFAEQAKKFEQQKLIQLKELLEQNNITLVIIEISNQNLNTAYLKNLSTLSKNCVYLQKQKEIADYFSQIKNHNLQEKQYLEFF